MIPTISKIATSFLGGWVLGMLFGLGAGSHSWLPMAVGLLLALAAAWPIAKWAGEE